MFPTRLLAALVLLALPACKKDEAKPGAAAPKPVEVKLDVRVDDKPAAATVMLSPAPVALDRAVNGLPPIADWLAVEAITVDGKVHTVLAPAKNHAATPPALSADDTGPHFGLLRDGKLEQRVDHVARVTVKTKSDAGKPIEGHEGGHGSGDSGGAGDHGGGANSADKGVRAVPTADLRIEIETPTGATSFTGDKMVGLPEVKAPSGDTETPGWDLRDVLAAAGVKDPKVVILTDEANASLKIEGDDWDPAKSQLYVKLNKSGQIRFRTFRKTGDVWEVVGELRGIKRIKIP